MTNKLTPLFLMGGAGLIAVTLPEIAIIAVPLSVWAGIEIGLASQPEPFQNLPTLSQLRAKQKSKEISEETRKAFETYKEDNTQKPSMIQHMRLLKELAEQKGLKNVAAGLQDILSKNYSYRKGQPPRAPSNTLNSGNNPGTSDSSQV